MFRVPSYYPDISLKLASVLEDIGVNERQVSKWRRTYLLRETLGCIANREICMNPFPYQFGSQVEGTTTLGLNSDLDSVTYVTLANVIEHWRDWEPDRLNMMMIQDEHTPPGYCRLRLMPVWVPDIDDLARYREHMAVVPNDLFDMASFFIGEKNGPAFTHQAVNCVDQDLVYGLPCKNLPTQVKEWLDLQTLKRKLTYEMKLYIESNKCFVVPVGYKGSQYEKVEWRISTSHAERCVMLNLNITQIRCYVMMKMILKTYLKHPEENSVSSFMCKNVFLLCIEKTDPAEWCPRNLLKMFTFYVIQLRKCVEREYCPHFIIHQNNLMAGKITTHVKHWLLERLQTIINSNGLVFLRVDIDDFGLRYHSKLTALNGMAVRIQTQVEISRLISGFLRFDLLNFISCAVNFLMKAGISESQIRSFITIYQKGNQQERVACRLLTPFLCTSVGSTMASDNINSSNTVSPEALIWLMNGFNSDVSSGKLKLASVFYSVGDFITVEAVLRIIESHYDQNVVVAVCGCRGDGLFISAGFKEFTDNNENVAFQLIGGCCVRFPPVEIHCVPKELKYEMFRSTADDMQHRQYYLDYWMDWAVVDSLPFLYFLQYKTYSSLQRRHDQKVALNKFISSLITTRNLMHKETGMNLLEQCMEQENRYMDALNCYTISLNIRPRNNAAKFHMCRLLYRLWHG